MNRTRRNPWTLRACAWAALSSTALSAAAVDTPATSPKIDLISDLRIELADATRVVAQLGEDTFNWVDRESRQERVVKAAPYCADAVHETIQPLADGNRIVQRQSTRLCRDGEGRTRQEVSGREGRRGTVYLRDPVARENWVLDPERKTARRGTRVAFGSEGSWPDLHIDTSAWREYGERMREWARQTAERAREAVRQGKPPSAAGTPPTPPTPPTAQPAQPAPPAPVLLSRSESTTGDAGERQRQVEVQVLRIQDGSVAPPMPALAPLGPGATPSAVRLNARSLAPRGAGVVTALPAREIEGVRVNGERTTWTIEAGKLGNEKPIVITREVWTSPELMLTVQTRDFDPRSGEVNYRLQNLKRGEPDAALFKVPADYETRPRNTPTAPSAPARG